MHVNEILSKDFKGVRWMPWRYQPKKDAVSCEKLRRAASKLRLVDIRMGKPVWSNIYTSCNESIVIGRQPGELKHLSTQRKRKKNRFPQ